MSEKFTQRIKDAWQSLKAGEDKPIKNIGREKIIVFGISIVLAFSLWFIVNLNRDYNLDVSVPLVLGNISTNQALAEELPKNVTASVNGSGWNLINLYNNPPTVYIDVGKGEVNLLEQVRQEMNTNSDVTMQTVEPLYLQLELEEKQTKKIPVVSNVDVQFAQQYGFISDPVITPDSITVRGAASKINNIEEWPTDSLQLENIKDSVSTVVSLKEGGSLIVLSDTDVQFKADVAQFTEGKISIPVKPRDFPAGYNVTFSPASVEITYRVPLAAYQQVQKGKPFAAYISFEQIQDDDSGFVAAQIEKLSSSSALAVKKVTPRKLAYFSIIGN